MSYILDALKKSEKKRKQGEVPDLVTSNDTVQKKSRKKNVWPYLIVIALLVNALVFAWFAFMNPGNERELEDKLHQEKTAQMNTDMSKTDQNVGDAAGVPKDEAPKAIVEEKKEIQNRPLLAKKDESMKKSPEKAIEKVIHNNQKDAPSVIQNSDETAQEEAKAKTEVAPVPPATDKVYSLSELPLAIQLKLPAFSMTAFIYSEDPKARMVRINGQMMREGDSLTEGPTLEEIVSDGLIFHYKGYRFRVGLK